MLRWTSKQADYTVYGFGLDAENVKRLQLGRPIIASIVVAGKEAKIVIHYGETVEKMMADLKNAGVAVPLPQHMDDLAIGATGKFPEGKFDANDEGELKVAVSHEKGRVLIDFGKSLSWIGFTPLSAKEFAAVLIKNAEKAEN